MVKFTQNLVILLLCRMPVKCFCDLNWLSVRYAETSWAGCVCSWVSDMWDNEGGILDDGGIGNLSVGQSQEVVTEGGLTALSRNRFGHFAPIFIFFYRKQIISLPGGQNHDPLTGRIFFFLSLYRNSLLSVSSLALTLHSKCLWNYNDTEGFR